MRNRNGLSGLGQLLQFRDMSLLSPQMESCCLIKIAVVNITFPGDGDQRATHESFNGAGVETGSKFLQITFQISRRLEPSAKPSQRHISKGEEVVEEYAPLLFQNLAESPLELFLRGG